MKLRLPYTSFIEQGSFFTNNY